MHTSPAIGAYRLKIRSILLGLVSGIEVHHEKVATREGFDSDEFQLALSERVRAGGLAVTVVESFIDARLARYTVTRWPGVAVTVFLTASEQLRARGKSTVMRTYASAGAVVVAPGPTRPLTLLLEQVRSSGERQVVAPKGRIEANESPLLAAIREISEEAGLHQVRYVAYLGQQSYQFVDYDQVTATKTVDWFLFATDHTATTVSEAEGFRAARWLPLDEAMDTASHGGFRPYLERTRDLIAWRRDASLGYDDTPAEPIVQISVDVAALLTRYPGVGLGLTGSAARGDFVPRWSDLDLIAWGAASTSAAGRALTATVKAAADAAGVRTSLRFAFADKADAASDGLVDMKVNAALGRRGIDLVTLAGDSALSPNSSGADLTTAITWLHDAAQRTESELGQPLVTYTRRSMALLSTAGRLIALALDPISDLRLSSVAAALSLRLPNCTALQLLAAYDRWRRDGTRDISRVEELAHAVPQALDELLSLVASDDFIRGSVVADCRIC